jgi:hypothetical protein
MAMICDLFFSREKNSPASAGLKYENLLKTSIICLTH